MNKFMKNIKYIAFYDVQNNDKENRLKHSASINKIDYICSALNRNGYSVDLISPSWSNNSRGYYWGATKEIKPGIKLITFSTFGGNGKLIRVLKYGFSLTQLFLFLITSTKNNETIIVYHSVVLSFTIMIAKYFKKLDIILELEEIYSEVWNYKVSNKREIKLINSANKYILVSDLLKERFNEKPNVVLYGGYVTPNISYQNRPSKDTKLLYAGSIDQTRGGAFNAIKCMEFLPNTYSLQILGFGGNTELKRMSNLIQEINNIKKCNCIKFLGAFYGDEFSEFISKCDIALNTQNEGSYMNTAFPSKILTYLSHNLRVVSTKIESILESDLADFIVFSESDTPQEIAKSIDSIDLGKPYDSSKKVRELDAQFVIDLGKLIKK